MSLVYAVHGVGSHEKGSISTRLHETIANANLDAIVEEFNWSRLGSHSPTHGVLRFKLMAYIISSISNVAFVESRAIGSIPDLNIGSFSNNISQLGHCIYYFSFFTFAFSWLTVDGLWFSFGKWEPLRGVSIFRIPFLLLWASLLLILLAIVLDAVFAIRTRTTSLLYISLRRNLLPVLCPPLILIGLPFVLAWVRVPGAAWMMLKCLIAWAVIFVAFS